MHRPLDQTGTNWAGATAGYKVLSHVTVEVAADESVAVWSADCLGGGEALARLQHCGQLVGRHRLTEVVTLNLVAAIDPQKLVLLRCFDPLGEHSHSEAVRQ